MDVWYTITKKKQEVSKGNTKHEKWISRVNQKSYLPLQRLHQDYLKVWEEKPRGDS